MQQQHDLTALHPHQQQQKPQTMDNKSRNNNSSSETNNKFLDPSSANNNGSSGHDRKSSLSDIPRAFLSSLRRASLTSSNNGGDASSPPSSVTGNSQAMAAATAAVSASIAAALGTSPRSNSQYLGSTGGPLDDRDKDKEDDTNAIWTDGEPYLMMAVPKAPPQDAATLAKRPPPKSILKKRLSDANVNGIEGFVASAAVAGAGQRANTDDLSLQNPAATAADATDVAKSPTLASGTTDMPSENIHPMATPDMNAEEIEQLASTSTDHRARLETNSPPPSAHPHAQPVNFSNPVLSSSLPSDAEADGDSPQSHSSSPDQDENPHPSTTPTITTATVSTTTTARPPSPFMLKDPYPSSSLSPGAAIPSDFIPPGMQSNSYQRNNRDGERAQGSVAEDRELSQAEMLNNEMMSVGARGGRYAGPPREILGDTMTNGQLGLGEGGGGGGGGRRMKRSINFLDKIEIIPVHRKADYNRSSDKHATFRVLTPDLKCEIRDELNHYKMREMAVHVDSMGNTAFH
ncbi:hypothetical protein EDD11_010011 [Mortierella claussenii]|nr:hypothetical protein EDD11_010011 [Mortierella claussenii]